MVDKFYLGSVVVTKSLNNFLEESESFQKVIFGCLEKHKSGNWGDTALNDCELNNKAIEEKNGDRIVSKYELSNTTLNYLNCDSIPKRESDLYSSIFIITENIGITEKTLTTLLFCSEY